ncbi:MAG: HNH endonuclease [Alphaproteobacteria bacterium]|nr:HNH endonuclease [Alphaproteobacteria bacterium]
MAIRDSGFSEAQKAEIYRLDRATCSYSGLSLWIADHGIDPAYTIDWADHIKPLAKGGRSTIDNGAAASWYHNRLIGDSARRIYLYRRGAPTSDFRWFHGVAPIEVQTNLSRFALLETADWYMNRALWHLSLAVEHRLDARSGIRRARDVDYYCAAALRKLEVWRRICDAEGTASIEKRNLAPRKKEPDQLILLSARTMTTTLQLRRMVSDLLEFAAPSRAFLTQLGYAESPIDLDRCRAYAAKHRQIPKRLVARGSEMAAQLEALFALRAERRAGA